MACRLLDVTALVYFILFMCYINLQGVQGMDVLKLANQNQDKGKNYTRLFLNKQPSYQDTVKLLIY